LQEDCDIGGSQTFAVATHCNFAPRRSPGHPTSAPVSARQLLWQEAQEVEMSTHAMRHDQTAIELPRWLIVGFISGAVSVLLFHQGAAALLHALAIMPRAPYSMEPTTPFGIPQVWSLAFWGGVWGVLLAATLARLRGAALIVGAAVFGAVLPTLVAWFVVAPLKGQPIAADFVPMAMLIGPIVNAAWGLGTGLGLALFGQPHPTLKDQPVGMRRARSLK
jgi:hypothetical protein